MSEKEEIDMTGFLAANWLWLAVLAGIVAMHLSGHGCGAHGRGHRHTEKNNERAGSAHTDTPPPAPTDPSPEDRPARPTR